MTADRSAANTPWLRCWSTAHSPYTPPPPPWGHRQGLPRCRRPARTADSTPERQNRGRPAARSPGLDQRTATGLAAASGDRHRPRRRPPPLPPRSRERRVICYPDQGTATIAASGLDPTAAQPPGERLTDWPTRPRGRAPARRCRIRRPKPPRC
ncbi:hypothetical protein HBB16_14415 [Pseudonocardia sp. MCCB 268]|nr:hypothetical protein [Pseudonocardia cytotoxica]